MTEPSSHSGEDDLRRRVRAEVDALLESMRAAATPAATPATAPAPTPVHAPCAHELAVVLTGREEPPPAFTAQLADLAQRGFGFLLVAGRTFSAFHATEGVLRRMPAGTRSVAPGCERALHDACTHLAGAVMPGLSPNTTAKLALGLDDSAPAAVLTRCLAAGRPLFVARDIAGCSRALAEEVAAAPPAFLRTAEDHLRRVQQLGVRFVPAGSLAAEVAAHFTPHVNETPARLARTRPSPRREFVTAEDVWRAASRGEKVLAHARDAIVTDAARDEAAMRGVELRPAP